MVQQWEAFACNSFPKYEQTACKSPAHLIPAGLLERYHMFGEALSQRQEAALGIKPGVCAELAVVWLKALDNTADAKLIVSLGNGKQQGSTSDSSDTLQLLMSVLATNMSEPQQQALLPRSVCDQFGSCCCRCSSNLVNPRILCWMSFVQCPFMTGTNTGLIKLSGWTF
jgi:hypothetical protein